MADQLSWEAVAGIAGVNWRRHHPVQLATLLSIHKPASSQVGGAGPGCQLTAPDQRYDRFPTRQFVRRNLNKTTIFDLNSKFPCMKIHLNLAQEHEVAPSRDFSRDPVPPGPVPEAGD